MSGKVKSFSMKNGYGFITDSKSSEDIFFGKEQLPPEWQLGGLDVVGRDVNYELGQNQDGKTQARTVRPAGPPPTGSRTTGIVKSWNQAKGFGFLRIAGLECDIFFARDRLPAMCRDVNRMEGLTFSFELAETADGKYQAQHMQNVGSLQPAQPPMTLMQMPVMQQMQNLAPIHVGNTGLKRPMHNGETGNAAKRTYNRPEQPTGRLVGTIKSYSAKNGYGFIVSNQMQEDIVIYAKDLDQSVPDLQQHNDVEFSVRYGNSGRPQAFDLTLVDNSGFHQGHQGQQMRRSNNTRLGDEYPPLTVEDLKLYTAQLNCKDLGDLAAYTTQMLQNKLGGQM